MKNLIGYLILFGVLVVVALLFVFVIPASPSTTTAPKGPILDLVCKNYNDKLKQCIREKANLPICNTNAGLTVCGNSCTNLQTDTRHCGSCNIGCGPGVNCVNGRCIRPTQTPTISPEDRPYVEEKTKWSVYITQTGGNAVQVMNTIEKIRKENGLVTNSIKEAKFIYDNIRNPVIEDVSKALADKYIVMLQNAGAQAKMS